MTQPNHKNMTVSDFNLVKLNTKQLSEHIAATIQGGGNIAIFGKRGTGKTEISKQEIKNAGLQEVYINLSVLERTDLAGFPRVLCADQTEKYVEYLLPQFYKPLIEGNKEAVVVFDEVDKADPSIWAPLLEFTQFKSINQRSLPNLKSIIMTGNLISEGGSRPSLPLLDRSEKYLVEADATLWLDWAAKVGHIHPAIRAYISDNNLDLHGVADPEDRYADPSPRGWTNASKILQKGEEQGWNTALLKQKVHGCVGKAAGIKYDIYYEHYQQLLPMIDDLFRGKDILDQYEKMEPSKKMVACMIACTRLANQLDLATPEQPPPTISIIGKFLQHVSYENAYIAIRGSIQLERFIKFKLDIHPDWKEHVKELKDRIKVRI